ncbi:MAG: hypothetical protein ACTSPD_19000 [Promethearchaeota archaeon]
MKEKKEKETSKEEKLSARWALEKSHMENRMPPSHWDEVRHGKYQQNNSK